MIPATKEITAAADADKDVGTTITTTKDVVLAEGDLAGEAGVADLVVDGAAAEAMVAVATIIPMIALLKR